MNLETKVLILAGGRGERLRPLTDKIPKPMLPVLGKPVLQHQIELFKKNGIDKIVIAGNYLFDVIKDYFGSGEKFGVEIEYCDEESPLGTGGAIKNAEKFFSKTDDFIVINGDNIIKKIDFEPIFLFHKYKKALATLIIIKDIEYPYDSDIVEIDEDKRVKRFIGKGQKELTSANGGIFIFKKEIFNFIPKEFCNIEKDVIKKIYHSENIYGYLTDEYIKDIGTLERYENVKKHFEEI